MGVKLAFYPNGQVRVTSQYDLSASFVFQPTRAEGAGARMQLIAQGEGGPQELPQLMRNWVEQEQCIPCFLASVTLECYDKWKHERDLEQQA
jgi:mitotic spindle assembly checkpoint protein MAD1